MHIVANSSKLGQIGANRSKFTHSGGYENFFLTHQNYLGGPTLLGTNDIRAKLTQSRPYMAPRGRTLTENNQNGPFLVQNQKITNLAAFGHCLVAHISISI